MSRWARVLIVVAFAGLVWSAPGSPDDDNVNGDIVATESRRASFDASALADAAPTTSAPAVVAPIDAVEAGLVAERVLDERTLADVGDDAPVGEPTLADTPTSSTTSTSTSTSTAPPVEEPGTTLTPTTTTSVTAPEPISLGEQALQRVSYPWRSQFPEWDIVFRGPRNGIRALTFPQDKRVEIFIRSSDTAASLHRVFAHELGHVIDVEMNSTNDRDRWVAQRGISQSAAWWPSAESPDFATGAGDFAEAFAVWETGVTTRSTVSSQPTAADLALLRELSEG